MLDQSRELSSGAADFIDEQAWWGALRDARPDARAVRAVLDKSLAKQPLTLPETALLLSADDRDLREEIFAAARSLKETVYGNRIVLFAPLYIGNLCVNDCAYCAFRRSNRESVRRTLSPDDIESQVRALQRAGHKRLIVVFGEHPTYDPVYMADCIRQIYSIKEGHGEIRRLNINAAPLDHEGFRAVKAAGIGTYQIFMETYHHETFRRYHPAATPKGDYAWRLDGVSRAMEAGCDDVGIGALFGLYDWRFEVLSLVAHARHLMDRHGVGPHTISFPRLRPAAGVTMDPTYRVADEDFKRVVAILRLAVPYTGLILTAREPAAIRRELLAFGVSQIDAGSRIELGGYTEVGDAQVMERGQFELGDIRGLDEVLAQLLEDGYLPSFCTACYRMGRTGEHFMEFAIPGFIKRFCTPNALTTLQEFLIDYAGPDTRRAGEALIAAELAALPSDAQRREVRAKLEAIAQNDERDLYF